MLLSNKNVASIYSVTICEKKDKELSLSGSSQHKLQHRCVIFDVCRLSLMMLLGCFFDLSGQMTSQELNYRNSSTAKEINY